MWAPQTQQDNYTGSSNDINVWVVGRSLCHRVLPSCSCSNRSNLEEYAFIIPRGPQKYNVAVSKQFKVHSDALGCVAAAAALPSSSSQLTFLSCLELSSKHSGGLFQANKSEERRNGARLPGLNPTSLQQIPKPFCLLCQLWNKQTNSGLLQGAMSGRFN